MAFLSQTRILHDFRQFLRFPSVSTQPVHRDDVVRCARWLQAHFRNIGLEASLHPTAGHPIVVARSRGRLAAPTVLIYGHYDVQPPDPIALWNSPPFLPVVRGNQIYARGAMDNKGQIFCHVKGVETFFRDKQRPPVNVIFLVEGEEEIGSRHLASFVRRHRRELRADVCLISDTSMHGPGRPAIGYGLRGVVCLEVQAQSASRDLHSGMFGGTVENPILALSRVLAGVTDRHGRIAVPGFYDDVRPMTRSERRRLGSLPFDEKEYRRMVGVSDLVGERGFTINERRWARPSFDINGISGGYEGDGSKTVIPSRAIAKVSFRLVPDQTPDRVVGQFRAFLQSRFPPSVRWKLVSHEHGAEPYLVSPDDPFMQAAWRAVERGFGCRPLWIREGGSIPVAVQIRQILGIQSILVGFGLGTDGAHAPNEHFGLDRLWKGIETSRQLMMELEKVRAPRTKEAGLPQASRSVL